MEKTLLTAAVAIIISTITQTAQADPLLNAMIRLYGEPVISANPDLLNSTSNDYGPWGAREFLYSFSNDDGPIGSPEFLNSVSNDYGLGLRIRLVDPVFEPVQISSEILEGY